MPQNPEIGREILPIPDIPARAKPAVDVRETKATTSAGIPLRRLPPRYEAIPKVGVELFSKVPLECVQVIQFLTFPILPLTRIRAEPSPQTA